MSFDGIENSPRTVSIFDTNEIVKPSMQWKETQHSNISFKRKRQNVLPDETKPYKEWTSKQLRTKCSQLKLRGLKNVKKHVLLDALQKYYSMNGLDEHYRHSMDEANVLDRNISSINVNSDGNKQEVQTLGAISISSQLKNQIHDAYEVSNSMQSNEKQVDLENANSPIDRHRAKHARLQENNQEYKLMKVSLPQLRHSPVFGKHISIRKFECTETPSVGSENTTEKQFFMHKRKADSISSLDSELHQLSSLRVIHFNSNHLQSNLQSNPECKMSISIVKQQEFQLLLTNFTSVSDCIEKKYAYLLEIEQNKHASISSDMMKDIREDLQVLTRLKSEIREKLHALQCRKND